MSVLNKCVYFLLLLPWMKIEQHDKHEYNKVNLRKVLLQDYYARYIKPFLLLWSILLFLSFVLDKYFPWLNSVQWVLLGGFIVSVSFWIFRIITMKKKASNLIKNINNIFRTYQRKK